MTSGDVYTGHWVRWARGSVMGSTLTLTTRDGSFMVAFLAIFVSFVGGQFWGILSFLLHQKRVKRLPQDALHHQQQAVLRNASSPFAALRQWLRMVWAWQSQTNKPLLGSLALMLIALLDIAGFTIAGIFSSHITSTNNYVLLRPQHCGNWLWSDVEGLDSQEVNSLTGDNFASRLPPYIAYFADLLQDAKQSLTYARSCYGDQGRSPNSMPECQAYMTRKLSSSATANVSCPFGGSLCASPGLELESGYVLSDVDLGMNTHKKDRVAYRRKLTCSVLSLAGYTTTGVQNKLVDDDGGTSNAAVPYSKNTYFYYGPDFEAAVFETNKNWTAAFSNYTNRDFSTASRIKTYDLDWTSSMLTTPNTFTTINSLKTGGGDVFACFLTNNAKYIGAVDDPWFSAHHNGNWTYHNLTISKKVIWQSADEPVSPLGCVIHHQFCNPNLDKESNCTDWGSIGDMPTAIEPLRYNAMQSAVQQRIYTAAWNVSLDILNNVGYEALNASTGNFRFLMSLPKNQWTVEVNGFQDLMMALIQRRMVSHVTGPSDPSSLQYMDNATTPEDKALCNNQVVVRNDYMSLSTFGIAMILAFGLLIILINLSLESIFSTIRKSRQKGTYRQVAWDLDQVLQLQRLAYEGQDKGTWIARADRVPITARGERFGLLDGRVTPDEEIEMKHRPKASSPLI